MGQYFLSVKNSFFRQVNGIPTDSDLAPFVAKFFLYYYENLWLLSTEKNNLVKGAFRYIDDFCAINDNPEFEKNLKSI